MEERMDELLRQFKNTKGLVQNYDEQIQFNNKYLTSIHNILNEAKVPDYMSEPTSDRPLEYRIKKLIAERNGNATNHRTKVAKLLEDNKVPGLTIFEKISWLIDKANKNTEYYNRLQTMQQLMDGCASIQTSGTPEERLVLLLEEYRRADQKNALKEKYAQNLHDCVQVLNQHRLALEDTSLLARVKTIAVRYTALKEKERCTTLSYKKLYDELEQCHRFLDARIQIEPGVTLLGRIERIVNQINGNHGVHKKLDNKIIELAAFEKIIKDCHNILDEHKIRNLPNWGLGDRIISVCKKAHTFEGIFKEIHEILDKYTIDSTLSTIGRLERFAERYEELSKQVKSGPWGHCPMCGADCVERRFDGNDRCNNGHVYPKELSLKNPLRSSDWYTRSMVQLRNRQKLHGT